MNKLSTYSILWWLLKITGLFLLALVGAFASNWANDFDNTKNISHIFSLDSFRAFRNTLILGIVCESLCIFLEKKIKEQEKLDDEIYNLGLQSVRNSRKRLEVDGRILEKEKLEQEIEIAKREIERDELRKTSGQ